MCITCITQSTHWQLTCTTQLTEAPPAGTRHTECHCPRNGTLLGCCRVQESAQSCMDGPTSCQGRTAVDTHAHKTTLAHTHTTQTHTRIHTPTPTPTHPHPHTHTHTHTPTPTHPHPHTHTHTTHLVQHEVSDAVVNQYTFGEVDEFVVCEVIVAVIQVCQVRREETPGRGHR